MKKNRKAPDAKKAVQVSQDTEMRWDKRLDAIHDEFERCKRLGLPYPEWPGAKKAAQA